jgi:NAD(P)-dependent dehydrogenase (short-subunit alcohol dehydrogenase family)
MKMTRRRVARVVAKEGAACNVRAIVVCPGFVRTPPVDQQIPEQAKELGINEDNVVKHLMLKDTVDRLQQRPDLRWPGARCRQLAD